MTERTIRSLAKELAHIFYDGNRSEAFRRTFPTERAYIRGQWHQPNGDIVLNKPGWMYHLDMARKILVAMLGDPRVSEPMKERIYDAWLEERSKADQTRTKVTQRIN